MSGFRAKRRQSLAYVRSAKALTGTSRDSALRSPDYQGWRLWRAILDYDLTMIYGDDCLAPVAVNSYIKLRVPLPAKLDVDMGDFRS